MMSMWSASGCGSFPWDWASPAAASEKAGIMRRESKSSRRCVRIGNRDIKLKHLVVLTKSTNMWTTETNETLVGQGDNLVTTVTWVVQKSRDRVKDSRDRRMWIGAQVLCCARLVSPVSPSCHVVSVNIPIVLIGKSQTFMSNVTNPN